MNDWNFYYKDTLFGIERNDKEIQNMKEHKTSFWSWFFMGVTLWLIVHLYFGVPKIIDRTMEHKNRQEVMKNHE